MRVKDLFTPFEEKLEQVRRYPQLSDAAIDDAVFEAQTNGLLNQYERERFANDWIDVVISIYRGTIWDTMLYATERIRDVHEERFSKLTSLVLGQYESDRLELACEADHPTDVVKIELIDFGAYWGQGSVGVVPQHLHARFAHAGALYGVAQNPRWALEMGSGEVPNMLIGGYKITTPPTSDRVVFHPKVSGGKSLRMTESRADDKLHSVCIPVIKN